MAAARGFLRKVEWYLSELQKSQVRYDDGEAASDDRERKENKMLRGFKLTAGVLCVVIPPALSGCAETIYPRLPDLGPAAAIC